MKLTQDLNKDTVSNLVYIENIEPIEEAEDLHGAERVEDMRVVPDVPREPTCGDTSQERPNQALATQKDPKSRKPRLSPRRRQYQIPGGSRT